MELVAFGSVTTKLKQGRARTWPWHASWSLPPLKLQRPEHRQIYAAAVSVMLANRARWTRQNTCATLRAPRRRNVSCSRSTAQLDSTVFRLALRWRCHPHALPLPLGIHRTHHTHPHIRMNRSLLFKSLRTANFSARSFSNSAIRMGVTVGELRSVIWRPRRERRVEEVSSFDELCRNAPTVQNGRWSSLVFAS